MCLIVSECAVKRGVAVIAVLCGYNNVSVADLHNCGRAEINEHSVEGNDSVKHGSDLCLDGNGIIELCADGCTEICLYGISDTRLAASESEGCIIDIHKTLNVTFEGKDALDDLGAVTRGACV